MELSKEMIKNSMPNLHLAAVEEKELFIAGDIDYTRPLKEYPTAQTIIEHISQNEKTEHIYTKDLNVNGICIQDSFEKYLGNPAKSSGMFKSALKTPMHYEFSKDGDKMELEALQGRKNYFELGEFLHQAILEPTKFGRVLVEPKQSLASTAGVEALTEFWMDVIQEQGFGVDENGEEIPVPQVLEFAVIATETLKQPLDKMPGKKTYLATLKKLSGMEPVTEENFLKIQILKKHYEAYGDGVLKRLLKHSKREISMYYTDPGTGFDVKIRPDALQFEENIGCNAIISVKSSGIEDLRAFYYQAAKLHYDLSEGMYQEVATAVTGRDFNTTIMVMLQTVAPFAVAILVWSAEDIEMGKYKYRTALNTVLECEQKQTFPGYDAFAESGNFGLIQMELPQWNNKEILPTNIEN